MKMKVTVIILTFLFIGKIFSQSNNCSGAVSGCSTPGFNISPPDPATDIPDFGTGTISNPSTNPNASPGNTGCLLTGETSSTFITINIVSNGTLAWSIQGATPGCFDWIMWPYNSTTCASIQAGTLPPVACCWNGACGGFTGMCLPGALPAGANQGDFENALNVLAGQSYLLCLSNFSSTQQNVNLNFFGTAQVVCGVDAADQTICVGSSATVNINTSGLLNPTFQWLETANVSNPAAGSSVIVTPTSTITYHVIVSDPSSTPPFIDTAVFTITVVNPPVPNAGIEDTICLGSLIQLNGIISNLTDTYLWSVNSTGINPIPAVTYTPNSNALNAQVNVNQPGAYQFILSENNLTCGIKTDTVNVFVSNITQTVTKTNPTCFGGNDGAIQINSVNAVQYSFDNGVTWVNNSIQTALVSGTYNVCSKNAEGCQTCSNIILADPAMVTISLSNDTVICQNGTATLIANSTGGNIYTFHWSQTNLTNNIQTVNPISNSYFHVFAENENGCISRTDSIHVTLFDSLTGTITPNTSICPGYPTNIIATVLGGNTTNYHFVWSSGETNIGPTSTIQANPPLTTQYTVTITDNCESTPLVLNSAVSLFPIPVPLFTIDQDSICDPAVFTIRNATSVNDFSHLKWIISDGEVINDQEVISTSPLKEGYYNVKLIVTSPNGCVDSLNKLSCLISMPKPIPNFSFYPNPVKVFNTNVSFANTTFNSTQFEWFIQGGSPSFSIAENPKTHFPEGVAASYEVKLIATSDFGCIDSSINYVVVLPEVILYAPNCFTPNGDEFNQVWKVTIDGIDVFDYKLEVYNRWGEIIWQTNDPEDFWDGTYNGRKVIDGTYNWMIETKDKFNDEKYRFNGSFNVIK